MASNPRILTKDVTITWDSVQTTYLRGTIVDVPAGSALEAAYGVSNLAPLAASVVISGDAEPTGDVQG